MVWDTAGEEGRRVWCGFSQRISPFKAARPLEGEAADFALGHAHGHFSPGEKPPGKPTALPNSPRLSRSIADKSTLFAEPANTHKPQRVLWPGGRRGKALEETSHLSKAEGLWGRPLPPPSVRLFGGSGQPERATHRQLPFPKPQAVPASLSGIVLRVSGRVQAQHNHQGGRG